MDPDLQYRVQDIVRAALEEDLALGDVTTATLFPDPTPARGVIAAQEPLVVAGVAVADVVFRHLDPSVTVLPKLHDGQRGEAGSVILHVEGDARSILMGERVALNFLQHLSGIATYTARFCEILRAYPTRVLDTRKTTPGLRALEKWAVRLGGGFNHRQALGDGILIKDNHLALLRARGVDLAEACRLAREQGPHGLRVIVEVESLAEVEQALQGGADVILLDNMDAAHVRNADEIVKGRAVVEVSGGMTLEKARDMAAGGADAISVGALTHSAPAVNISMHIVPLPKPKRGRRRTKG